MDGLETSTDLTMKGTACIAGAACLVAVMLSLERRRDAPARRGANDVPTRNGIATWVLTGGLAFIMAVATGLEPDLDGDGLMKAGRMAEAALATAPLFLIRRLLPARRAL